MRGTLVQQIETRAPLTIMLETSVFLVLFFWRVSAMMLLGMVLFRTGILTGQRPAQ